MKGVIDAMAHLDDPRVTDPGATLARAAAAGVDAVVNAGVDPLIGPRSGAHGAAPDAGLDNGCLTLRADGGPVAVASAFGIHPQAARREDLERQLAALEALAARPGVVALGELGLDARSGMPPAAAQERALDAQLALARALHLPVILHCVRRLGRLMEILRRHGPLPAGGMLHGFAGPPELVPALCELGLSFSFGGLVTRRTSRRCRAAARVVPADRLLVESDTPDHPPQGWPGPSEPAALGLTLSALAALREVGVDELAAVTAANARRIFRW